MIATPTQSISNQRIGFYKPTKPLPEYSSQNGAEVLTDIPTEETVMAMEETMNDIKNNDIKVFYNSDELMNDIVDLSATGSHAYILKM